MDIEDQKQRVLRLRQANPDLCLRPSADCNLVCVQPFGHEGSCFPDLATDVLRRLSAFADNLIKEQP